MSARALVPHTSKTNHIFARVYGFGLAGHTGHYSAFVVDICLGLDYPC